MNALPLTINPFASGLKESATLSINLKALEMRGNGMEITHLGFGQSPFPVPERLQNELKKHVDKKEYLPTQGLERLRKSIVSFYKNTFGYDFHHEDVFIGPGSKELIFDIIYLTEGVLLFPSPSWVSYGPQAHLRGKATFPIKTKRENCYRLEAKALEQACKSIGPAQKLLILNNPNNPTGTVYSDEEIREISAVCKKYGILVISDEIYALIDFTAKKHSSIAKHYPEGTIVTGGLSKVYAAGGYRLGLAMIPPSVMPLRKALKSLISETFSAVSAPTQHAACDVYENAAEYDSFIATTTEIHEYASHYLMTRFHEMGLNCPKPEGSFYLFPDFDNYRAEFNRGGIETGEELTQYLLDHAGVALLPGSDFYLPDDHFGVRVASVDYDGTEVMNAWPGKNNMNESLEKKLFPNLVSGCDRLESCLQAISSPCGRIEFDKDTPASSAA